MDLRTYLVLLWRRRWVIALTIGLALAASGMGTQLIETRYRATTTLRLMTAVRGSTEWVDYDLRYADRLMNTYTQVARSDSLTSQLVEELGLVEEPIITADIVANTELMKISVEYSDAVIATKAANLAARLLISNSATSAATASQSTQLAITDAIAQTEADLRAARSDYQRLRAEYGNESAEPVIAAAQMVELAEKIYERLIEQYPYSQLRDALQTPLLTVLDPAVQPLQPFQPKLFLNLALGLAFGLAGGLTLTFLLENLSLHTLPKQHWDPSHLLPSHASTIPSLLPLQQQSSDDGRHAHHNSGVYDERSTDIGDGEQPADARFCRFIYTAGNQGNVDEQARRILIAGIESFPGRIALAFEFAANLVAQGKRVVLIDSDYWEPTHPPFRGLSKEIGLSSVLLQHCSLWEAIWLHKASGVHLIPAGPQPHHPEQLIASSAMATVLNALATQFDVVIINAPALNKMGDIGGISRYVDGIVLSVENHHTWQKFESFIAQPLSRANASVLGVLMQHAADIDSYSLNGIYRHSGVNKRKYP